MKWIVILVFLNVFQCADVQSQKNGEAGIQCVLLEKLFQEKVFYELPSMNLSYVDTITILDKAHYFNSCELKSIYVDTVEVLNKSRVYEGELIKSIYTKTLVVKTRDLIPFPLDHGLEDIENQYKEKYKCYFLIEEPKIKDDLITVKFYKLLTNHSGYLVYKIVSGKYLELMDYQIGQY